MKDFCVRESALLGEKALTFTHESGLQVALIPKQQKKAYALFATRYGSMDRTFKTKDDRDFITVPDGIAHFLEHKMFENEDGTDTFGAFAAHKASSNAFTSNERTAYLFSTTEDYYQNLEILLKFVTQPYFTKETVEKEVGIIAQEIGMYQDDPGYQVYFGLVNALYRESYLKIDIAGTVESIKQITPEILYRCHRTFYDPHNMMLCLVGPFQAEQVQACCDRILPRGQDLQVEKRYPTEPREIACRRVEKRLSVSKDLFLAGMKDVAFDPEDSADQKARRMLEMEVLCEMLFGKAAPLYQSLYDQGLIADDFFAGYNFSKNYGFLEMGGESSDPDAAFRQVEAYLEQVLKDPRAHLSPADFERCRKVCYANLVQTWNSPQQIAHNYLELSLDGVDMLGLTEVLAKMTYDHVLQRLEKAYDTRRLALSVVRPNEE